MRAAWIHGRVKRSNRMRVLNETEMRIVAGGVQPMTRPEPRPCWEVPDVNQWWVRELLLEERTDIDPSL